MTVDAYPPTASNYGMSPGEKISRLLDDRRVTQAELGEQTGILQTTISKITRGERRMYADQAFAIARCLGVTSDYLMDEEQDEPREAGPILSQEDLTILEVARSLGYQRALLRLLNEPERVPSPRP